MRSAEIVVLTVCSVVLISIPLAHIARAYNFRRLRRQAGNTVESQSNGEHTQRRTDVARELFTRMNESEILSFVTIGLQQLHSRTQRNEPEKIICGEDDMERGLTGCDAEQELLLLRDLEQACETDPQ